MKKENKEDGFQDGKPKSDKDSQSEELVYVIKIPKNIKEVFKKISLKSVRTIGGEPEAILEAILHFIYNAFGDVTDVNEYRILDFVQLRIESKQYLKIIKALTNPSGKESIIILQSDNVNRPPDDKTGYRINPMFIKEGWEDYILTTQTSINAIKFREKRIIQLDCADWQQGINKYALKK